MCVYSEPTERIGGCTWPIGQRKGLWPFHLLYPSLFFIFLHVGLCASYADDVAARDASDEMAFIDVCR